MTSTRTFNITQFETRNLQRDTHFFQQLVAFPEPLVSLPLTPSNNTESSSKDFCATGSLERNTSCSSTSTTLYPPSKRWNWINDHQIIDIEQIFLSDGAMCDVYLKTANVGDRQIKYICKTWRVLQNWHGAFYSELALYKKHMKNLQGDIVPSIITVLTGPATLNVAMEPPHHSFWIEASTDMPLLLKDRCVQAFQRLHECGVLHGDVELRHMLIGGDGKVTIIDFQESRALEAIEAVHLKSATPAELKREMRKVKVKLDYPGCRELEYSRLQRYHRRLQSCSGSYHAEEEEGDELENPPITDVREWEDWVRTPPPRRFVMPEQTPSRVFEAIQNFLDILDLSEPGYSTTEHIPVPSRHDMRAHELSPERRSTSRKRSIENDGSSGTASPPKRMRCHEPKLLLNNTNGCPSRTEGAESSSSRKRASADEGPRRKRIRLDGHLDPPRHQSVSTSNAADDPPHFHIHETAQNLTRINVLERRSRRSSPTSDTISMHNLALCALEKLPHPTLVQLFPNHPRWQDPDVSVYLDERLRKRQEIIGKARAFPNKIFFSPGEVESRGNLRRTLVEIRQRIGYLHTIPVVELPNVDTNLNTDTSSSCGRVRFSFGDPVRESGSLNTDSLCTARRQSRKDPQRSVWWHRPVFGWLGELLSLW